MHRIVPLELLAAGEQGRVYDIDGGQPFICRLEEMGLRCGVPIRMVRPGEPCIIVVNNHRMSFRGEDSTVVLVELGEAAL